MKNPGQKDDWLWRERAKHGGGVVANIFKVPMLGDVRLDHQLNSILATKKNLIDIDAYILKGGGKRAAAESVAEWCD